MSGPLFPGRNPKTLEALSHKEPEPGGALAEAETFRDSFQLCGGPGGAGLGRVLRVFGLGVLGFKHFGGSGLLGSRVLGVVR